MACFKKLKSQGHDALFKVKYSKSSNIDTFTIYIIFLILNLTRCFLELPLAQISPKFSWNINNLTQTFPESPLPQVSPKFP